MILAGTGHRPDKLGGYNTHVAQRLQTLASAALTKHQPQLVISGMALGWDQALAEAAVAHDIPFHAYVPFEGQESMWPLQAQQRYQDLLWKADKVIIVCEGSFAAWKMQKRNEAMVDACDKVLALWNGTSGGTANCVAYAKTQNKPIFNLWHSWEKYR